MRSYRCVERCICARLMTSLHAVPTRHRRVSLIKSKRPLPSPRSAQQPKARHRPRLCRSPVAGVVELPIRPAASSEYPPTSEQGLPRPARRTRPVQPIVGVGADESGYETRQSHWGTNNEIRTTLSSRERQTCRAFGPNRSTILPSRPNTILPVESTPGPLIGTSVPGEGMNQLRELREQTKGRYVKGHTHCTHRVRGDRRRLVWLLARSFVWVERRCRLADFGRWGSCSDSVVDRVCLGCSPASWATARSPAEREAEPATESGKSRRSETASVGP